MDCSDSRLWSSTGSGGGECASREGPRVGQGDPIRAETGERPRGSAGRSAFPAWAPRPRFPRLREAPGPLRRPPLPVPEPGFPRGPCARGAGAPRSREVPRCTGPWLVWWLGPSLPGSGAERWSCLLGTLASPPPHPSCPRGGDYEARTHRAWTRTVPVPLCDVPLRRAFEEGQRQRSEPDVISRNSRGVSKRSSQSHYTQW